MPEGRAEGRGEQPPVDLRPFRGIAYNPAHVDDLFALLAPPYDVISQQERERYYQQHPHNVVRLIYGRDEAGDTAAANRYTRAANYLQSWLQQGVLQRDSAPSMYLCAERYLLPDGTQRERQGLIALCRLEPYERGIVLPHEETSPVPKRMLFDLRSAVKANLSQIFALYDDDTGKLQEIFAAQRRQPTRLSFRDQDHMLRRVWAINEPSLLTEIRRVLSDYWTLIADGHHRYETCLAYQQMRHQHMTPTSGEEWFNFAMLYLTDIHDPGLTILPTHRALRDLAPALVQQIPTRLRDGCEVEAFPFHTSAERDAQRQRLVQEAQARGPDRPQQRGDVRDEGRPAWLIIGGVPARRRIRRPRHLQRGLRHVNAYTATVGHGTPFARSVDGTRSALRMRSGVRSTVRALTVDRRTRRPSYAAVWKPRGSRAAASVIERD